MEVVVHTTGEGPSKKHTKQSRECKLQLQGRAYMSMAVAMHEYRRCFSVLGIPTVGFICRSRGNANCY